MKSNVQVKDEPVEFQIDKLLRLYTYQSAARAARTKSTGTQEQEGKNELSSERYTSIL